MWEKIYINLNKIETVTNKAVLIKMPSKSIFKGFEFWHPKKLVRDVGHSLCSISFTKDFEFKLQKMGKGQYNFKEVLEEVVIDSEKLKKEFGFDKPENEVLEDLLEED